jgi:hypothetical protein
MKDLRVVKPMVRSLTSVIPASGIIKEAPFLWMGSWTVRVQLVPMKHEVTGGNSLRLSKRKTHRGLRSGKRRGFRNRRLERLSGSVRVGKTRPPEDRPPERSRFGPSGPDPSDRALKRMMREFDHFEGILNTLSTRVKKITGGLAAWTPARRQAWREMLSKFNKAIRGNAKHLEFFHVDSLSYFLEKNLGLLLDPNESAREHLYLMSLRFRPLTARELSEQERERRLATVANVVALQPSTLNPADNREIISALVRLRRAPIRRPRARANGQREPLFLCGGCGQTVLTIAWDVVTPPVGNYSWRCQVCGYVNFPYRAREQRFLQVA